MPDESSQNNRNIADNLSEAAGVTPTKNDNAGAGQGSNQDQHNMSAAEKDKEEEQQESQGKSKRVAAHLKDKRQKQQRFEEHFGTRGDDRRSGLRISEDGAYEWSVMEYNHDEGVSVFRMQRDGDNLQREKKQVPLEEIIELNPDPSSHSRLKEIQAYSSNSTQESQNTTDTIDTDTAQASQEQTKNASSGAETGTVGEEIQSSDLSDEQKAAVQDAVTKHNLSEDQQTQLVEMIEQSENEYTQAMIENVAAGLKEHERVGAGGSENDEGVESEKDNREGAQEQPPQQEQSSKRNVEENLAAKDTQEKAGQDDDETRAKRAVEEIASGDGPISEEAAKSLQQADSKEMQDLYKKAREKQGDSLHPDGGQADAEGVTDRVGSEVEGAGEDKEGAQKENKSYAEQKEFFNVAIDVLERLQKIYNQKEKLSDTEEKKRDAIKEALDAYKKHHKVVLNGEAVEAETLQRRVTGLNKAVNAHPKLKESYPGLIRDLQSAQDKLDV